MDYKEEGKSRRAGLRAVGFGFVCTSVFIVGVIITNVIMYNSIYEQINQVILITILLLQHSLIVFCGVFITVVSG